MQGRRHTRRTLGWILFLAVAGGQGCGEPRTEPDSQSSPTSILPGDNFDPGAAATIQGRVTWQGDLPVVPLFQAHCPPLPGDSASDKSHPNPNAPIIDPKTRAVKDAVVFLRGVEPRKSRPWDHPPVKVDQEGLSFHVRQGKTDSHVGWVRRGDSVEMVSRESRFHSLHAGGAAFFTLPFPDPDSPRSRCLDEKGVVELSSAAGYYWMRAYLFVDDHPYYTRTAPGGRFVLEKVPPGHYEVVCWMPSWVEDRHDRDPELGYISRLYFRRPMERAEPVTVAAAESKEVSFDVSLDAFPH